MKRIVKSDTMAESQKYNTRYIPGVTIKCLEDIFSIIVPSIRWYTEGKEYVIQDDYTIIEDTGDKIPFLESALFKRRAFKRIKSS